MFLAIEKELLSLKTNYKPNYYLLIFTPLHSPCMGIVQKFINCLLNC